MLTQEHHIPRDEAEIAAIVADCAAGGRALEICGNRSKRGLGRPVSPSARLSTRAMNGLTLYEPAEMVISALAGTPVGALEASLAAEGQELPFEPADWGHVATPGPGLPTVGGMVAAATSGPRAIVAGGVRDALIGVRLVNGRGEVLRFGGRVLKNVTGLDVSRLMAGAFGTLGVIAEATFRVQPKAEDSRTLIFIGLPDDAAVSALCMALGSPAGVSATMHIQAALVPRIGLRDIGDLGANVTALRLEGYAAGMAHRIATLHRRLKPFGEIYELDTARSRALWDDLRAMNYAMGPWPLWRIGIRPERAAAAVAAIARHMECRAAYEWSGGQIWLEVAQTSDASATDLRRLLAPFEAEATLMRAPAEARSAVEVFPPRAQAETALVRRIKAAFDPAGILNPERLTAGV